MIAILYKIIPKLFLSKIVSYLSFSRNIFIKYLLINFFIYCFKINLVYLSINSRTYKSFNDFFTRGFIKKSKISSVVQINSPVNGTIMQFGKIYNNTLIQSKGKLLSMYKLLDIYNDNSLFKYFGSGSSFMTIYLSPDDYHCVHMPVTAKLLYMKYINGGLLPVNHFANYYIPNLLINNERVVSLFEFGSKKMVIIFIGAIIVGNIKTCWHGVINFHHPNFNSSFCYKDDISSQIFLNANEKIGSFCLGSTVILLFEKNSIEWNPKIKLNDYIKYSSNIGKKIL